MNGYEIKFNIYAEDEQEVAMAREAIVYFINAHAQRGRAVTGRKIAEAVARWDRNPFIKNKVIEFFN
jgi:hypothetical protein